MVKRAYWLSITPEPERELPEAVATLAAGRRADPEAIAAEQARIERLILHGGQRRWLAYLHDVVDLIAADSGSDDPDVGRRASAGDEVIANHHNLLLGLPDPAPAARRTATDSSRLGRSTIIRSPMTIDHDSRRHRAVRRASRPAAAGARLRRAGPAAPGAHRRGRRRPAARRDRPAIKREAIAARLHGRTGPGRARRPGLVDARVVPGQRAVRARHQRAALARPQRLQRVGGGQPRAGAAVRGARAARRGRRRLRRHRGRGRLRSQRDRHHRRRAPTPAGASPGRSGSSPRATWPAC